MINFIKVARQLKEARDPETGEWIPDHQLANRQRQVDRKKEDIRAARQERMARNPIVRRQPGRNISDRKQNATGARFDRPTRDSSQGGMGFWAEKVITQHILPKFRGGGEFKNIDVGSQGHNFGIKTDIYQDKGGDPSENIAYSVKSKMDNDHPQKVHQTGIDSKGTASKLLMRKMSENARFAMDSYLGVANDNEFHTSGEIKERFPEIYTELKEFLDNNKTEIFNNLVRRQGVGGFSSSVPYGTFDPRMIDSLISHRVTGENNSGPIDIRDFNGNVTKENFENLQWFDDGKRFFLGEDENAPTDMRMLDLWPIDEEGSKWSNRVGDGGPRPGQRGHKPGRREAGLTEPGQFKATMATNPEFLDKYFPKVAEWDMHDDGETLGFKDVFNNASNPPAGETPKNDISKKPEVETYADGTPKNDIPFESK